MVHKHDNERPDDDDGEAGMQGGEFGLLFHRIDRPRLLVFLHALLRWWYTNTAIYHYEHETAHGEDALHILALYPGISDCLPHVVYCEGNDIPK